MELRGCAQTPRDHSGPCCHPGGLGGGSLDNILAIKVVEDIHDAWIISRGMEPSTRKPLLPKTIVMLNFFQGVDAAAVYVNASALDLLMAGSMDLVQKWVSVPRRCSPRSVGPKRTGNHKIYHSRQWADKGVEEKMKIGEVMEKSKKSSLR